MAMKDADRFGRHLQRLRLDAVKAQDWTVEAAISSLLWLLSSGQAFTGFEHVCAHMDDRTALALVRRITDGMIRRAHERRPTGTTIMVGDLDNGVLARALGYASSEEAEQECRGHPLDKSYFMKVSLQ